MSSSASTSLFPYHDDFESADMHVTVAEAMNPSRRPQMEDIHVIHAAGDWPLSGKALNDKAYLAVYDGHGGRDMVDFLEHSLSRHLAHEILDDDETVELSTRLERAFLITDIHALKSGVTNSGATVACCVIQRLGSTQLRITAANAGDARIVVGKYVRGHSKRTMAIRLTHDHNAQDPMEVIRIEQAGGFIFKNRVMGILAITRSLGDHQLKPFVIAHPHVQDITVTLDQDPFVIVACDGFFDVVTDQQAVDLVRSYQQYPTPHKTAAQCLVDESIRRGTSDNVTVMVAFYSK
ncbi:hypothetical protein MPSEU_001073100 [Mayamaea pseudoterrestris]|nr:hypothetical protein MPSEU_001073100 [Mayamaea pseudoterrestris]